MLGLRSLVLVVCAGVTAIGCKSGGDRSNDPKSAGELSSTDMTAIRATDSAFVAAANAGNVDGVVAVYASDAALLPPNLPPQKGRNAIRSFWAGFLNAYTVRFEADVIEGRGDLAYTMGYYRFTAAPKAKADPGVADEASS